jgi:ATP-dependent exoDNAse (exonuclease V) alpha subunit
MKIFYLPNNEKTRRRIDLGYAITIHKAQGSEFREIYLFLTKDQKSFVNIKTLYTAITRAKEKVNIIID